MTLITNDIENIDIRISDILNNKDICQSLIIPLDINLFLSKKIKFSDIHRLKENGIFVSFSTPKNIWSYSEEYDMVREGNDLEILLNQPRLEIFTELFLSDIKRISFDKIIDIVLDKNEVPITPANIPQFSNFDSGTIKLLDILRKAGNYGPNFEEVGRYLTGQGKKESAYKKYGENHSKLAENFDFVYIIRKERKNQVYLTSLGKSIIKLPKDEMINIIAKLAIQIPIIRSLINDSVSGDSSVYNTLRSYLAISTTNRRKSNVKYILKLIQQEYHGTKYREILDKIV